MNLAMLALRNLVRNRRRTALTLGGIGIGLGLMHTSNNFARGSYDDLLDVAISDMAGHVVVEAKGYHDKHESSMAVERSGEVAATIQAAFPDAQVTRRAFLDGLIVSPTNSVGAALTAVQPEPEAAVGDLDDKLVRGEWLDDDPKSLLIGADMADVLDVDLGDKVVFMAQKGGTTEEGGEMTSRLFRVRGIYKTGAPEIDGFMAYSGLPVAQEVLGGDDPATQVALHLADPRDTARATAKVKELVPRDDVEILPWQVALAELKSFIELDASYSDMLFAVIGLIVAMGVLNTVLMSVLERVREFGVMMAVGMRPRRLALMVLLEGAWLGLVGAAIGYVLGALFSWPLVTWGVDFSSSLGESYVTAGVPMDTYMHAVFNWIRMAKYSGVAVVATVLASAWPAWRVSRLQPVEAIHHH